MHYVDFNKRLDGEYSNILLRMIRMLNIILEWINSSRIDLTKEVEWPAPEKPDKKKSSANNKALSKVPKNARPGSRDVSGTPDALGGKNLNVGKAPRPSKAGGKENRTADTPGDTSLFGSTVGTPKADSEDVDMADAPAEAQIKEDEVQTISGEVITREEEIERLRTSGSMTQNPTEIHRVLLRLELEVGALHAIGR